uniref:DUF4407 domain-containing protein n=1 Tax=Candidatus Kentrum sp. DK TaxID=2126562 RepID=A0A450TP96_9GAMM|nr:MAG: protein of unknown function (DUF4407) [Candidatus Kentron sp. DK]
MSLISRFLQSAAGIDPSTIRSKQDQYRYASLGALVWFSALVAAMAFGYAVYVFLAPFMEARMAKALAVVSVPLWFFFVFHINRATISVITPGKGKKFSNTFKILPRLLVSVVISIAIAHPLVLFLLSEDISGHYRLQIEKEALEKDDELRWLGNEIGALDAEIKSMQEESIRREEQHEEEIAEKGRIEKRIEDLDTVLHQLTEQMACERSGGVGNNCEKYTTSTWKGAGSAVYRVKELYEDKNKTRDLLREDLDKIQESILSYRKNLENIEKKNAEEIEAEASKKAHKEEQWRARKEEMAKDAEIKSANLSFLQRNVQLVALSKENGPYISVIIISIFLFLFFIELTPVFIKLMFPNDHEEEFHHPGK